MVAHLQPTASIFTAESCDCRVSGGTAAQTGVLQVHEAVLQQAACDGLT